MNIAFYTAQGGRIENEDAVKVINSEKAVLAIAADGLGGHDCGERASECAVSTISNLLSNKLPSEDALINAIQSADCKIKELQKNSGKDMKTTIAVAWIGKDTAVVAHVGDTRIYQFRDNEVIFQSLDHSVAQMAVMVGEITANQIRGYKDQNKLIRALGSNKQVKVTCELLNVLPDDAMLLCTDGFWELINEDEMITTFEKKITVEEWLKKMRSYVEKRMIQNGDNHSAIAIYL